MQKRRLASWLVLLGLLSGAVAPQGHWVLRQAAARLFGWSAWVNYQTAAQLVDPWVLVEKSASPAALPEPGGLVTFSIRIVNPFLLRSVQVTQLIDSVYGNVTTPGHDGLLSTTCSTPQQIDQLGEYTCSFSAIVTGNAGDQHTNVISVYAQTDQKDVVAGETATTVNITDLPSSLAIKKQASASQIPESGAEVVYSLWITNTSAVDSIQLNQVNDDQFGNVSSSCKRPLPVTLPAGGVLGCTFSRFLQGQAGTTHTNLATATGIDDDDQAVSANAKATVIFFDTPALLTLSATVTPTAIPEAGGAVTFTLQLRNASSADAITVKALSDTLGKVSASCQPALTTALKAGETMSCRYQRTLQGDYGTSYTNQVTASGVSDDNQSVTAQAETQVAFTDTPAALTIQKTPSRATVPASGAVVTFTVQVDNSSLADSLTLDQLSDSRYGVVTTSNPQLVATNCAVPRAVPKGGRYTCQFSALLSGTPGTVHTNILTVKATDDDNAALQAQASASVTLVGALLLATKEDSLLQDRNGDGVASPGDTIGYTVLITNAGNLADTIIFTDRPDANTRLLAEQATSSQGVVEASPLGITVNVGSLAPSGRVTINFPVTVVDPLPVGSSQVSNQGLVIGAETPALPTDDPDTPALDDPTTTLVVANPRLVAAKRVGLANDADGDGLPSPGDTLSYTIRLANVGNQQALGVELTDPLANVTTLVAGSTASSQGQVVTGTSGNAAVSVQLGDLPVGAVAWVRFQAQVVNPLPAGISQISNQGHFTGANLPAGVTDNPDTPAANDATTLSLAAAPWVQLTKRDLIFTDADGDGVVSPGDTLLYILRLSNVGNTSALNVQLNDTPDPQTALVAGKVQASGGQILSGNAANDRAITLAVAELLPQQHVDLAFRVLVKAGAAALTNQATGRYTANQGGSQTELTLVSDDPDTAPANDATITPLGTLPTGDNRVFFPLIRR